ncbi:MAG: hypothetical protein IKW93_01975 [Bacteroidales bacterium]|nr:hypothetical protein [Bacteroidales bacterium]
MPVAIGTLAMLVGNVGLQIFNNWRNSRQSSELQQKHEEFEQAVRDHQTDRMWKIMREGQKMTLELEQIRNDQRVKELGNEMDQLIENIAYQHTIENWPLKVLPIVMKNQAIGNFLTHQEESIAMHCIFTPSNDVSFNRHVFPYVEKALEDYCNQYWSSVSSHPILFYSGAWKKNKAPTPTQIDSLRTALSSIPTVLIIPFFRSNGKLVFRLRMWGVGATSDNSMFGQNPEIEPENFRHEYTKNSDYDNEVHLLDDAISDIVPYLQCLIGYIADTYFWSASGLKPHFPMLITDGSIGMDKSYYLLNNSLQYYGRLLEVGKEALRVQPFAQNSFLNLYDGYSEIAGSRAKEQVYNELKEQFPYFNWHKVNEIPTPTTKIIKTDEPYIICRKCGDRCYLVKGKGYYKCCNDNCGWEGVKVII